MKDIVRFLIILMSINLLIGVVQGVVGEYDSTSGDYNDLQRIGEENRDRIETEYDSANRNPESFQGQTEVGGMEDVGKFSILKIIKSGLDPFPTPANGYETQAEEGIAFMIGLIRSIIWAICGIMFYLIIFNKANG